MLKWDRQPARRGRSWADGIRAQRIAMARVLRKNPSLKARLEEALGEAYEIAGLEASSETDLDVAIFPETCPYDWQAVQERELVYEPPPPARRASARR